MSRLPSHPKPSKDPERSVPVWGKFVANNRSRKSHGPVPKPLLSPNEPNGLHIRQAGRQLVAALCGRVWNQVHWLFLCRVCLAVQRLVYPQAHAHHEVKHLVAQGDRLQQKRSTCVFKCMYVLQISMVRLAAQPAL